MRVKAWENAGKQGKPEEVKRKVKQKKNDIKYGENAGNGMVSSGKESKNMGKCRKRAKTWENAGKQRTTEENTWNM